MNPVNTKNETNSIDIVFITYWEPPAIDQKNQIQQDIDECVTAKLSNSLKGMHSNQYLMFLIIPLIKEKSYTELDISSFKMPKKICYILSPYNSFPR